MDCQAVGPGDFGRPGNYVARQIARWSSQYRASETVPIEAMELLMEWLPANMPAGNQTTITHGDLRLDNMIFHLRESRIVAVLDWELSTLWGPPRRFCSSCNDLAPHA